MTPKTLSIDDDDNYETLINLFWKGRRVLCRDIVYGHFQGYNPVLLTLFVLSRALEITQRIDR